MDNKKNPEESKKAHGRHWHRHRTTIRRTLGHDDNQQPRHSRPETETESPQTDIRAEILELQERQQRASLRQKQRTTVKTDSDQPEKKTENLNAPLIPQSESSEPRDVIGDKKAQEGFAAGLRKASNRMANLVIGSGKNEKFTGITEEVGLAFKSLDKKAVKDLEDTKEDIEITRDLSELMEHYRGDYIKRSKTRKSQIEDFKYTDLVKTLKKHGIPVPSDDQFAKLESVGRSKWDPDGTVVEYYSPVLRSFIPINMRGRYRGCWSEDHCVQGLDVSQIPPKPDALEGYIDRGRQEKIKEKCEKMFDVAQDERHLDYLIEMEKFQAETLPIPLMYDVLNFGMEVLKNNIETIVVDEGIPPTHRIYQTTETHILNLRKKLQSYAAIGLEPLNGEREQLGTVEPTWTLTRDQLIQSVLARRHMPDEYEEMLAAVTRVQTEMGLTKDTDKKDNETSLKDNDPKSSKTTKDVDGKPGPGVIGKSSPSSAKDKSAQNKQIKVPFFNPKKGK